MFALASVLAACGPARLAPATSRAEQCRRVTDPSVDLAWSEFCDPSGPARCGVTQGEPTACVTVAAGEQPVCQRTMRANGPITGFPSFECRPATVSEDCPANWECRAFTRADVPAVTHWCFPGPPCSSATDAGADQ